MQSCQGYSILFWATRKFTKFSLNNYGSWFVHLEKGRMAHKAACEILYTVKGERPKEADGYFLWGNSGLENLAANLMMRDEEELAVDVPMWLKCVWTLWISYL